MPRRPLRLPLWPGLVIVLTVVGPGLVFMGIDLWESDPDAWIPLVVGAAMTTMTIPYLWLTRPHSFARWKHAALAMQWGSTVPARSRSRPKPRPTPKPKPPRRRRLNRRRR
ncbi:hypothetical protein KZZ52_28865 [Dactylosporangium sp. AC04546]|uniref:hypothetical protein n=1 Tax=Dactylosporangium sp. AC04546 TaxID=2862460 RepID=UPI001EDE4EC9|nr:hypothetical protein [Dactylosporangium sp. AC04546]WVK89282.1 hypothetical protein KZZ52_28865 [Dactylosporangium sp. AC04546]